MNAIQKLEMPPFFDPANAGDFDYSPDVAQLKVVAEEWRKRYAIKPAANDQVRMVILDIDSQSDFSHKEGSLYVAGRSGEGAIKANAAIAAFEYSYLNRITSKRCTLDSHQPTQIFFPMAHLYADGSTLSSNTFVSVDDYSSGRIKANPYIAKELGANPTWLNQQYEYYCGQLESKGKKKLFLWDEHTMLGSKGHRLAGVIEEARLFHSYVRFAANSVELKGFNNFTEHYSIFEPEVTTLWNSKPMPGAQKNTQFLNTLLYFDIIIICGLASSHCVMESVRDLKKYIIDVDPKLASKVYIMADGTAPVVIPGVYDYTDDADAALEEFKNDGMNVVNSTEPLETWPGVAAIMGL